jgi:hypothetical protein
MFERQKRRISNIQHSISNHEVTADFSPQSSAETETTTEKTGVPAPAGTAGAKRKRPLQQKQQPDRVEPCPYRNSNKEQRQRPPSAGGVGLDYEGSPVFERFQDFSDGHAVATYVD